MAVFNGPPRAGSRGGRDQFNWEDVRGDKDASYYIGHSVKALSGRWQKNKDLYWYTREQNGQEASVAYEDELKAVKQHEEQLMAEVRSFSVSCSLSQCPQYVHALDARCLQLLRCFSIGALAFAAAVLRMLTPIAIAKSLS
jgi:Multiple myeloma tumor-associated